MHNELFEGVASLLNQIVTMENKKLNNSLENQNSISWLEYKNQWLKENVKYDQKQYWGFPGQFPEGGHPEELKKAEAGEEPYASWLTLPEGVKIPVSRELEVNIMVAGGETNPYWQAGSLGLLGTASVDEWR